MTPTQEPQMPDDQIPLALREVPLNLVRDAAREWFLSSCAPMTPAVEIREEIARALKEWRKEDTATLAKIDRRHDLARAYNYSAMEERAFEAGFQAALALVCPKGWRLVPEEANDGPKQPG